jgi:hypothetical protein
MCVIYEVIRFANSRLLFSPNTGQWDMYVCVRGGPNQPLHRDLQWSIVLANVISTVSDEYSCQFS